MQSKRAVHAAVRSRRRRKPGITMEVHAPEHSIHTWREFLIHMGAIILGLLIAIGLEQSVEWLHHRHQRHQLEEDVRAEARRNVEILTTHLDVNIPNMLWYRAALTTVRATVPKNGSVDVTLPPPSDPLSSKSMVTPRRIVWPVAMSSGATALLSESVAQAYANVDFQAQEDQKEVDKIREAAALIDRFELVTGAKLSPGQRLHITLAERDQLMTALAVYAQQLYALLRRDNFFLLDCQAIGEGIEDDNSLLQYQVQHGLRINKYRP